MHWTDVIRALVKPGVNPFRVCWFNRFIWTRLLLCILYKTAWMFLTSAHRSTRFPDKKEPVIALHISAATSMCLLSGYRLQEWMSC